MRKAGILLHPTSLPGEWGIGDLGTWAYRFADFLVESGMRLWQILPLGPTGPDHSPYQSYSSMAGNPLLISIQSLYEQGWLSSGDLQSAPPFPPSMVHFDAVIPLKTMLIRKAAGNFFGNTADPLRQEFLDFCSAMKLWLNSYAEFTALKQASSGLAWTDWTNSAADPQEALTQQFIQFVFFRQWKALKDYCNSRGIEIIGDLPIFIAHDSSDVWANPELFDLDEKGHPRVIAGVPPDYFSKTGQCWGNPLYRWEVMEQTGYRWWIQRIQSMLNLVDIIRLDHFRGFEKFWEIPAGSRTAVNGRWVRGPGESLFKALSGALGKLPFIAEDLGYITPEVHQLRDRLGLPGMRVLQFAFGDLSPENPHKPYNFIPNCVAYTGTHDNDTTAGWLADTKQGRSEQEAVLRYLGSEKSGGVWDLIRLILSSAAGTAILPMQDVLGLGSEARMNLPATTENNWRWRMRGDQLSPELAARLHEMIRIYGRARNS
jgi:4-alpha-glucanotransferase